MNPPVEGIGCIRSSEGGSAMVGAAASFLAAGIVLVVALHVGVWLHVRSIAAGAADHAALAAAGALAATGRDPSGAAGRVATELDARIVACRCTDLPVQVEVAVALPDDLPVLVAVVGADVTATATARLVHPP